MAQSVLSALDLKPDDNIIVIRENKLADANFILTGIFSKCISNNENICLVILHSTVGHFQNVGKRFGYDFLNQIKDGRAKTVEPMKDIVNDISGGVEHTKYLSPDKETVVKNLFAEIEISVSELQKNGSHTTIVIDDISHLMDLGVDLKHIITFFKYCTGLTMKHNVSFVVNCHVTSEVDEILSNVMFHAADLALTVSALKTGRSKNVSGVLTINRRDNISSLVGNQSVYHYKLMDKEIRTFAPGRGII